MDSCDCRRDREETEAGTEEDDRKRRKEKKKKRKSPDTATTVMVEKVSLYESHSNTIMESRCCKGLISNMFASLVC